LGSNAGLTAEDFAVLGFAVLWAGDRLALAPHQPAINRDHRAGHIVGQIRRQELDDLGAILDCPETLQRHQLGSITVALVAPWNDGLHDPSGRDHAGGDAVRGDPERPEILRQIPGNGR